MTEIKHADDIFYEEIFAGKFQLKSTSLSNFKKDDLKRLALLHAERLIHHIERRKLANEFGGREQLERFIKACDSARGRI